MTPPVSLEQGDIVAPHPGHHGEYHPIILEEAFCLRYQPVAYQYLNTMLAVDNVVGFT